MAERGKTARGPSLEPQQVIADRIWYYENCGSIEIYLLPDAVRDLLDSEGGLNFKIRKSKLEKSLARMNS